MLQRLAEEIVTDWCPCWHGSYTGGVRLNQRQNDSKAKKKKKMKDRYKRIHVQIGSQVAEIIKHCHFSGLNKNDGLVYLYIFIYFIYLNKSHLTCCCGSDCTAVRSASEGQCCSQLALCYWSRACCSTVAQRHGSHSRCCPCSVGGSCWAPLLI